MAQSGRDNPVVPLERERERTVELLSQHFAYDNISLDELERRMEQVYRASSVQALRDITRDLPSDDPVAAPQARGSAPLPQVFAPEAGRIVSCMATTKRSGLWQPPRHLRVWSVMSELHLDLTEAQLAPGVTEIHLTAVMASVKIIVPRGVRVVVQPSAFMAEVSDETFDPPAVGSGAPVVRLTGQVFMAELKVSVRVRELSAD
jgi:hypothetical protein